MQDASSAVIENTKPFHIKLPLFEGPIDLLLHLVKVNELSIEKIALAQVASQYLSCLDLMRGYDLEVAGEYLVIASTLLSIKSSVLLNEPVQLVEDEEGNLVDPHEELLLRLKEAAIFHEAAASFANMPKLGVDVFAAPSSLDDIASPDDAPLALHPPIVLQRAFQRLLKKLSDKGHQYVISFDSVSVVDRMMSVLGAFKKSGKGTLSFEELLPKDFTKIDLVGTFIALLELCRRGAIDVAQAGHDEEVFISQTGVEVSKEEVAGVINEY